MKVIDLIKNYNDKEMAYWLTCMIRRKILPTDIDINLEMDVESTYLYKALIALLNANIDDKELSMKQLMGGYNEIQKETGSYRGCSMDRRQCR